MAIDLDPAVALRVFSPAMGVFANASGLRRVQRDSGRVVVNETRRYHE
jgi:hypothetical protein